MQPATSSPQPTFDDEIAQNCKEKSIEFALEREVGEIAKVLRLIAKAIEFNPITYSAAHLSTLSNKLCRLEKQFLWASLRCERDLFMGKNQLT